MENQAHTTAGASPCEAELQELMEQIDIMVSNKKLDWERKMRALETRLDLRDQELANAQTCLDQKGQEVGLLRQKLDSLEKCNLVMTQNYEGQLQTLKAQFSKLTSNFEKLRLHQMKQSQIHRKESSSKEELPFELSSLNQKLEEFRAKSREWDKQEVLYQTHLVSLDAQQKLLSEKCSQFQKQAQNYQTQLNGKKQCPEDSSSEIPRLVCESDPGCEATQRDEFIIEKLKSAVSEIALSRNKLQDENQKLLQELKMYQRQCQAMEAGLSEVKNELQSRDDLLRIIEMERLHLHRELLKMGELQTAQDNRKRVESSYSPSPKEAERKRKELFSMVSDQPNHEKELNKMRSQLYQEESLCTEQERLRNEISELTQELHQKEVTIATVMKKAALLERQLKIELEIKERMLAKQQVSDRRYKAVRTENTHLKGMMGDLDPARYLAVDLSNKKHSQYTSINKLEYENERLRSDLAKLHGNGKASWPNQSSYGEAGAYVFQSQLKTETSGDRISQDCELNRSPTPLSPLPFQTKEMASPLVGDNEVLPLSPPDISFRASLAAQHFLMEEERRAKELEKLLNTHIDELQRHTEFTLNKYTKLKQSRHI
ncbi:deuterosome assembly protein 1 isoform X1 [Mus caroli]|uniref:Deuterosome assembly protein 1 n=2 Tax=Mus caroli TaxID=10089 RepID=A0A6P5QLE0_MUSCR|nr:deuterosome assembly protein 1 isoform X1 [Mus caroli]XP_021028978.1 deuterosome assembly protein 1 isoform X1 [Mus caroli]